MTTLSKDSKIAEWYFWDFTPFSSVRDNVRFPDGLQRRVSFTWVPSIAVESQPNVKEDLESNAVSPDRMSLITPISQAMRQTVVTDGTSESSCSLLSFTVNLSTFPTFSTCTRDCNI